jgi:hypothetical protein
MPITIPGPLRPCHQDIGALSSTRAQPPILPSGMSSKPWQRPDVGRREKLSLGSNPSDHCGWAYHLANEAVTQLRRPPSRQHILYSIRAAFTAVST